MDWTTPGWVWVWLAAALGAMICLHLARGRRD